LIEYDDCCIEWPNCCCGPKESKINTERSGADNLKWFYSQADDTDRQEGKLAYFRYNSVMYMLSNFYDMPLSRVTAAFCHLSPNNDYIGNLRSLVSVLEGMRKGVADEDIIISTYNHCKDRAISSLRGDPFETKTRGLKILSFYHNILNPLDPNYVTVDGHMIAAYRDEPDANMKESIVGRREYREIANEFFKMAAEMDLIPNQLQATIWFTRKRIYNIKYNANPDMFNEPGDKWGSMVNLVDIPPYPIKESA